MGLIEKEVIIFKFLLIEPNDVESDLNLLAVWLRLFFKLFIYFVHE